MRLAQIANQSSPLQGCEQCCNGLTPIGPLVLPLVVPEARARVDAIKAVAAFIKATRDVHMATVNVQLDSIPCPPSGIGSNVRGSNVRLKFGGSNSAYHLAAVPRLAGYSAAVELQQAQAAELAARGGLASFGLVVPDGGAVAPVSAAAVSPAYQLLAVHVPEGLSGGQSLQVQTPMGMMTAQIPEGLSAGQSFQIQVPLPPQVAQPGTVTAQPVAPMPPAIMPMTMVHT